MTINRFTTPLFTPASRPNTPSISAPIPDGFNARVSGQKSTSQDGLRKLTNFSIDCCCCCHAAWSALGGRCVSYKLRGRLWMGSGKKGDTFTSVFRTTKTIVNHRSSRGKLFRFRGDARQRYLVYTQHVSGAILLYRSGATSAVS